MKELKPKWILQLSWVDYDFWTLDDMTFRSTSIASDFSSRIICKL